MTNRERFEEHVRKGDYRHRLERYSENGPITGYINTVVEMMWRAWQAALASDQRRSVQDMEDAIAGANLFLDAVIANGIHAAIPTSAALRDMLLWFLKSRDIAEDASAAFDDFIEKGRKLRMTPAE